MSLRTAAMARELIRRAIALHVLETQDVNECGSILQDARELVAELKTRGWLSPRVDEALGRLVELLPSAPLQALRPARTAPLRRPSADATVAPAAPLSLVAADATLAPGAGPGTPVSLVPSDATVAPGAGPATPVSLVASDATLAPGSDPLSIPHRAAAAAIPAALVAGDGTVAPGAADPFDRRSLVAPVDTLAGGADLMGDTQTGQPNTQLRQASRSQEALLDLNVLGTTERREVEAAAAARIAHRLGLIDAPAFKKANAEGANYIEGELILGGVIDQTNAMEIFAIRQETRAVCTNCFAVLAPAAALDAPCRVCGQVTLAGGPSGRHQHQTLAGDTGGSSAHGIEGFPEKGGTFAGYELIERVAEGGMGVVFKARQTKLNRLVALKVMRGGSLAHKDRRRRFLTEAESAATLKHPCIVPVHEIDEVAGYPFYTMDFVEGVTLDLYVLGHQLGGPMVSSLVRQVVDAVQHFHQRGIIHRDLKPANILVAEDAVPRIIDFGIAKKVGLDGDSDGSTIEGEVLGTPYYMSPEQAAGRVADVDTRTDVYALGVILYELLAGAPPWKGLPQAKVLAAIQDEDPPPLRAKNAAVDVDLESIIAKAMSKERERRYQTAAELAGDLENYEQGRPIIARPATLAYRTRKYVKRHQAAVVAGSLTTLVVLAVAGWAGVSALERRQEVARLVAQAREPERPLADAEALVQRALGLDPDNLAAKSQRDLLQEKRLSGERAKEEEARARQARLEAELARERAEREATAAKEREKAREDAEARARAQALEHARTLLAQAEKEQDPLAQASDLSDALALLPAGPGELRATIEARKLDLDVRFATDAVKANEAGLARFWLRDAFHLAASSARAADLEALQNQLAEQATGERDLEDARALARAGDWPAARAKLRIAREAGIAPERIERDEALVQARCSERAQALVAEGQAALARGDALAGLASGRESLRFEPTDAGRAVVLDCEGRVAEKARRDAAAQFALPEGRARALAALDEAERAVQDASLKASLRRERRARARLVEDRALADLAFVPDVAELSVQAFYCERAEVTNERWKRFVDAGGYENAALWDQEALPLLPTFRDACPGGQCQHRAPRTWQDGSYGDPANADRPVRGVTAYEVRAFARWWSGVAGGRWRVPTEAEWEVAAGWDPQAGRVRTYPWGESFEAGAIALDASLPRPVLGTPGDVSALGLADAAGNVLEWVERPGKTPGTKGASYASEPNAARHFARVRSTGTPGAAPSNDLLQWIGARLVREIEEK